MLGQGLARGFGPAGPLDLGIVWPWDLGIVLVLGPGIVLVLGHVMVLDPEIQVTFLYSSVYVIVPFPLQHY